MSLTIDEALALITNPEVEMYVDSPIVKDLLLMMTASPKIGDYYGMYHWVLEHGQYFLNEEVDRQFGPLSHCFFTSQLAITNDPDLLYVEGYVQGGHPILHGWNITREGEVIDRTLRIDGCEYWGVVFNTGFVQKEYVEREAIVTLIGNWEEDFPLIRSKEIQKQAMHVDWNHGFRRNPDEDLRELQRIYDYDPTPDNLRRLQTAKTRAGHGRIIHLRRLAEEVAEIINAEEISGLRDSRSWNGEYQGIKIHINARRLYDVGSGGFLQIGRLLAHFEVNLFPEIEMESHPEAPIYINEGREDYYELPPEQPWMSDGQTLLDFFMEINRNMEARPWYQQWREANAFWL